MKYRYEMLADAELFALLKAERHESEAAFTELYQRYATRINAYCLHIVGNRETAEDIFQETFVRFYNSARQDAENGRERATINVPGFLITIARNLCLNHKQARRDFVPVEENTLFTSASTHGYESSELMNLISTALELLDSDYREAFVLREYDGLSYAEIGRIVNTNEATAKTRVFRAKQKVQQILQPYLDDLKRHA